MSASCGIPTAHGHSDECLPAKGRSQIGAKAAGAGRHRSRNGCKGVLAPPPSTTDARQDWQAAVLRWLRVALQGGRRAPDRELIFPQCLGLRAALQGGKRAGASGLKVLVRTFLRGEPVYHCLSCSCALLLSGANTRATKVRARSIGTRARAPRQQQRAPK